MPRYRSLSDKWNFIPVRRDGDWKIGMLGYSLARREGLQDLHIVATRREDPPRAE